ncbi:MAG TPA: GPW/gp25 family protein [Thermoanaerobaculia bacterium]|nr:GPW/gp25 family protein [Thermoanaerobaculia bacterium]
MQIDFPYHVDSRGRTAETDSEEHVRDLIEQVLFTAPGERVNRPTFGCGLLQQVFAPNGDVLATAVQLTVQGALQQWLGDRIQVESVDVSSADATLSVTVVYRLRRDGTRRTAQITGGI